MLEKTLDMVKNKDIRKFKILKYSIILIRMITKYFSTNDTSLLPMLTKVTLQLKKFHSFML